MHISHPSLIPPPASPAAWPDIEADFESSVTVGAWLAAAVLFLNTLSVHPAGVSFLHLGFPERVEQHLLDAAHRGWRRLVPALHALMQRNVRLQRLAFRVNFRYSYDDDGGPRGDPLAGDYDWRWPVDLDREVAVLREEAAAAATRVRLAVLLGHHPRAGRCSVLQLLPPQILTRIVTAAVPTEGCRVVLGIDQFGCSE